MSHTSTSIIISSTQSSSSSATSSAATSSAATTEPMTLSDTELISTLQILDPILQFLTKATGRVMIPWDIVWKALPQNKKKTSENGKDGDDAFEDEIMRKKKILSCIHEFEQRGILAVERKKRNSGEEEEEKDLSIEMVGFPSPDANLIKADEENNDNDNSKKSKKRKRASSSSSSSSSSLHGSSKTAGKRRLTALRKSLKEYPLILSAQDDEKIKQQTTTAKTVKGKKVAQNKKGRKEKIVQTIEQKQTSRKCLCPKNSQHDQRHDSSFSSAAVRQPDGNNSSATAFETTTSTATSVNTSTTSDDNNNNNDDRRGPPLKKIKYRKENEAEEFEADKVKALRALCNLFQCKLPPSKNLDTDTSDINADASLAKQQKENEENEKQFTILPKQASYAKSIPSQKVQYGSLPPDVTQQIPSCLLDAFNLSTFQKEQKGKRRLYQHQVDAITSIMQQKQHTIVCTGTGSGKSLCFLLPVLACALQQPQEYSVDDFYYGYDDDETGGGCGNVSLLLFPTKALAQDQYTKLTSLLQKSNNDLLGNIRPGILDGDTPHSQRTIITSTCNIIFTNPDTLHAHLLPSWKKSKPYQKLLSRIRYIVVDEAHLYSDGSIFGTHVSFVLKRLYRLCVVSSIREMSNNADCIPQRPELPIFIACSATIFHPEQRFRLLCPISKEETIRVINPEEDTSPKAEKHYFVWNPEILDMKDASGNKGTGRVEVKRAVPKNEDGAELDGKKILQHRRYNRRRFGGGYAASSDINNNSSYFNNHTVTMIRRRHAADETARLLAHAIIQNIRCITFCKTRSLVEWVYERTISILQSNPSTSHLTACVESYRGGYTCDVRRSIERKLFQGELRGVVGTNALELGVDVGGIDLTLHCGYPGSMEALLQQSGRAGRGGGDDGKCTSKPSGSCVVQGPPSSFSIVICFSSPAEQHLWRHPKSLLCRPGGDDGGLVVPPENVGIVQGHLLCAGDEFPLTGESPVAILLNQQTTDVDDGDIQHESPLSSSRLLTDAELFGSKDIYEEARDNLIERGSLRKEDVSVLDVVKKEKTTKLPVFKTHPVIDKPWTRVHMRCIEQINYSIVDVSHPLQGGRMDSIVDKKAIMDTIPYSRVFYHAYPGAIIMHRGKRYKVHCMNSPPPLLDCSIGYNSHQQGSNLGAFAKPTTAKYSTQPLSINSITVVKQLERVEVGPVTAKNKYDVKGNKEKSASSRNIEGADVVNEKLPSHFTPVLSRGVIAGNGVVTVKRTVHGYKKLSLVTRAELSRTEITVPPMEYDTNALWIDAEASVLSEVMLDYDAGVHALSHALVAVAPLFVPCTSSDLDCDHTRQGCTRILLFDVRAGGAGTTAQLWTHIFRPNGMLPAAINLLEDCPSLCDESGFQGGCPACLQSCPCVNFHQNLSRRAGLLIARRMLGRIQQSELYRLSASALHDLKKDKSTSMQSTPNSPIRRKSPSSSTKDTTPRRLRRERALRNARDLVSAQKRQIVVGRPTWPTDQTEGDGKAIDSEHDSNNCRDKPLWSDGGFMLRNEFFQESNK